MQALEGLPVETEREVAGVVCVPARDVALVQRVAELVEHAARGDVARDDRRVDALQRQVAEGEGVQHEREARAEALALRSAGRDEERELGVALAQPPQIAIARELAVSEEQERARAVLAHVFVVLDDLFVFERVNVPHQGRVMRVVVGAGELGGVGRDVGERRLERRELAARGRPGDLHSRQARHPLTVLAIGYCSQP